MVAVVVAILGYAAYVYISQLCLPMIKKREGVIWSRATGSESPYNCLCFFLNMIL